MLVFFPCRFKDEVECDRIVLRAFLTPHLVTAFRAAKPDYLHQLLQEAGGTRSGEGTDGGVSGRKSFSSAAQKAAQVRDYHRYLIYEHAQSRLFERKLEMS